MRWRRLPAAAAAWAVAYGWQQQGERAGSCGLWGSGVVSCAAVVCRGLLYKCEASVCVWFRALRGAWCDVPGGPAAAVAARELYLLESCIGL